MPFQSLSSGEICPVDDDGVVRKGIPLRILGRDVFSLKGYSRVSRTELFSAVSDFGDGEGVWSEDDAVLNLLTTARLLLPSGYEIEHDLSFHSMSRQ